MSKHDAACLVRDGASLRVSDSPKRPTLAGHGGARDRGPDRSPDDRGPHDRGSDDRGPDGDADAGPDGGPGYCDAGPSDTHPCAFANVSRWGAA